MKRPLVPVAFLYAGGIILADSLLIPLPWTFGAAVPLVIAALLWGRARPWLLCGLVFLSGLTNQTFRLSILSPNDLRMQIGDVQQRLTIRGTLTETPYLRITTIDEEESIRTVAFLETTAALWGGTNWHPVAGQIMVSHKGALPTNFFGGQVVELTGTISRPQGPLAQGLFDYRAFLRRQGIYYQFRVTATNDWRVLSSPPSRPLADRFCTWAQGVLARGLPETDESLELLWTMTLGWKTALNGEIAEPFMRSGTMHIFAISGLHIALIALILVRLFSVVGLPRGICGLLVLPAIWFYTGVTGWQASAIRSTIMSSVVLAGWSLNRPSNLLNSLAASGLLILIWDPQQLFQASFQLSFFVVLSLALFSPPLIAFRDRLLAPPELLPDSLVPNWRKRLNVVLRVLSDGLITSFAAWLGSMPLIAYYFNLFTPGSLLANLLVVPISSLALTCNVISLGLGGWFPWLTEIFNHSAWFWMTLMINISKWFAWLRGSCIYISTPGPLLFFLYYMVALGLVLGIFRHPRFRRWSMAAVFLLALLWTGQWLRGQFVTRLTILPCFGGQAIYLDAPGNKSDCLIDCGDAKMTSLLTQPYLKAQGVNRLPRLFLTHGDVRHVGGADTIRAAFSISQIHLSPVRFRSAVYRDLKTRFEAIPGLASHIKQGDRAGPWTVLYPSEKDRFPLADDNCLVLLGQFGQIKVLLLSDLGRLGQNELASRQRDLRADIVIVGLPGPEEPLAEGLLDLIQPRLVIIADSEYPASARASEKLKERLSQRNLRLFCTMQTGVATITFGRRSFKFTSISGLEAEFPNQSGVKPPSAVKAAVLP